MFVCFRYIGVITIIVFFFHMIFIVYDDESSKSLENQPSPEDLEHQARLFHLNATLTLVNKELRVLNHSLHHNGGRSYEFTLPISTQFLRQNDHISPNKAISKRAILFTMDSISSYETAAHRGGAAGEIIIRKSLEDAFQHYRISLDIIRSDAEFENKVLRLYDIIILDPWTWAAKGWVPKPNIRGMDDKVYIMDFFGSMKLRGSGLDIPPTRFLTAYGSPWNPFLGYYILPTPSTASIQIVKKQQGIIWGKDIKHFDGKHDIINIASTQTASLVATINAPLGHNHDVVMKKISWQGHQSREQWMMLLSSSKFLLGLGNPLLGPSAIDAVSVGCMYINPIYDTPMRDIYDSQHPYAAKHIGEPYVCSYHINDMDELRGCIEKALTTTLTPMIPEAFTQQAYYKRVVEIFHLIS